MQSVKSLESLKQELFQYFIHAIMSCITTSAFGGKAKKLAWQAFEEVGDTINLKV